jgi:hypothetical protein
MRALRLLQQRLAKPVISPRETATSATVFPDLAGFRQMARLLLIYQYVALADGRVADAIAALRESVRLGQVVQTDTPDDCVRAASPHQLVSILLAPKVQPFRLKGTPGENMNW